jgi:hypothetical protein
LQRIAKEKRRCCKEEDIEGVRVRKKEVETQAQTVEVVNSGSGPDYQIYIPLG